MKRTLSVALTAGLLLSSVAGSTIGHAQAGKSVVIGMGQEPDRLFASGMLVGTLVQNLVYDTLVQTDDRMQAFAQLAADIPSLENGLAQLVGEGSDRHLEVTMPLRQGVSWSDGTPFTADDIVYLFGVIMNPESGWDTSMESKIKTVDKLDDFTVKFTWMSAAEAMAKDPETYRNQGSDPVVDPQYFFGMNIDKTFTYPRHKLAEVLGDDPRTSKNFPALESSDFSRNPVGTGPYQLSAWDAGVSLTFQSRGLALPHRLALPSVDTITFRIIPSKDTAKAALEAGEIQMITQDSLDVGDSTDLDRMAGVRGIYVQGTAWEHITINLDNPILSDQRVRQAIAYGLNRQELVDVLLFGKSEPANSQIPSWSWAYNDDVTKYQYNPGQADQLLIQAGWTRSPSDGIRVKDGKRLSLNFWSTGSAFRPRALPLIKNQLEQIGIELNTLALPASEFFDAKAKTPRALSARQFDLAEFAWVNGYDPGSSVNYNNHSKLIPSKENGYAGGNYSGYRNARNDQLLDQGQASLDQSFRVMAYAEAQVHWMNDLPVIPLFLRPITVAATDKLTNLRPTMSSTGETWNAEQWDLLP